MTWTDQKKQRNHIAY